MAENTIMDDILATAEDVIPDKPAAKTENIISAMPDPVVPVVSGEPPAQAEQFTLFSDLASENKPNPEISAQQATNIPPGQAQPTEQEKRGPGRPKGARNRNRSASDINTPAEQVPQVDYELLSQSLFGLSTNALSSLFGPEWQPRNDQERDAVTGALKVYLQANEVPDIPPGMMLTIIVCAYAAPRLREPSTSGKLKAMWYWMKTKFARKKKVPNVIPMP